MMSMNGNGGSGVEDLLTRLESRPKASPPQKSYLGMDTAGPNNQTI